VNQTVNKIIISIIIFFSFLHSAEVKELAWPKGESFLLFLEKYSIPQKLYFNLEKEDKELCSEIVADKRFYLYTEDNGDFNQVLIPVSEDIQIHIYKAIDGTYKFQTLPINYKTYTQTIAIPITKSVSYNIKEATGDVTLAIQLQSLFKGSVDFRKMRKGDFIALNYTQKTLLGKKYGLPTLDSAMVEVRGKKYYRFKNKSDDKYYNEKGVGFTKTYFFKIPLTYKRISSVFTKKRWHPVLKRYRAHLGTDFAAPRGRKIYAAAAGTVEFKGRKGGYGNTIIINHHNGYKTLYAHQNRFRKSLKRGQRVKKGEHIGYVGTTGLSSGPHLHLGLYKNGRAIDPMKVFKKANTNGLKGKTKKTFIANAKITIQEFKKEINNQNRTKAKKFDRINYKNDLKNI